MLIRVHFACTSIAIQKSSLLQFPFFADLVVIARSLYPIPSRTRPSKSSAPMVLNLKVWKSRSLPGLPRTERLNPLHRFRPKAPREAAGLFCHRCAGSVARHARAYRGHLRREAAMPQPSESETSDPRLYRPHVARNREPILEVLK